MTSLASILILGFVLGLRHATDADHVVAVTTLVARERRLRVSALVGALWGAGHTLTLLLLGGAMIVFRVALPPRVGLGLELAVAAMLVALGGATLLRARVASSSPRSPSRAAVPGVLFRRATLRPLLVGVVHGLAGSGAISLLVLSTIDDPRWAIIYLVVFGAGTVGGMMLLTTALGLPFVLAAARFERWSQWLARGTGLASIALGVVVAYQLIASQGLLSADPRWIPQ
jgi:high-affinity nickel-transport protein